MEAHLPIDVPKTVSNEALEEKNADGLLSNWRNEQEAHFKRAHMTVPATAEGKKIESSLTKVHKAAVYQSGADENNLRYYEVENGGLSPSPKQADREPSPSHLGDTPKRFPGSQHLSSENNG